MTTALEQQLQALRIAAGQAGDMEQVELVDRAIDGDRKALATCIEVLAEHLPAQYEFIPVRVPGRSAMIVNERCTCGALKTQHEARWTPGSGPCPGTDCLQFTFREFVVVHR